MSSPEIHLGLGFSNHPRQVKRVGEAFGYVLRNPDIPGHSLPDLMAMRENGAFPFDGRRVVSFSAGMIPISEAHPLSLTAFAAPLPKTLLEYSIDTIRKYFVNHLYGRRHSLESEVACFNRQIFQTLILPGAVAHWKMIFNGTIPRFDAIDAGARMLGSGKTETVELVYGEADTYFQPSDRQLAQAETSGVQIISLPGFVHDSLLFEPEKVLSSYLERSDLLR